MYIWRTNNFMYKRIFIIIFIVTLIILILYQKNYNNCSQERDVGYKKYTDFYKQNYEDFDTVIKDRFVIKDENGLSIGKSKNELDNGYYDVKIAVKDQNIEIYLNKLFKDFNFNLIYDESYIDEIVKTIIKIFNLNISNENIKKVIIDNYIVIRDTNRNNVESVDKTILINEININISVYQNILVLKLGDVK